MAKAIVAAVTGTRTEAPEASTPTDVLEPEYWKEIAILAYYFWQERGCPIGSPEEDWFRAEQAVKAEQAGSQKGDATELQTASKAAGRTTAT